MPQMEIMKMEHGKYAGVVYNGVDKVIGCQI